MAGRLLIFFVTFLMVAGSLWFVGKTGYLEFYAGLSKFNRAISLMRNEDLQPGQTIKFSLKDDAVFKEELGRYKALVDHSGYLFFIADLGGGHLSARGFIYSEAPEMPNLRLLETVGLHPELKIRKIKDNWYRFYTEEG